MSKRLLASSMALFSAVCVLLFVVFYRDAKDAAVARLNAEQRTHARQAARGLEDFFRTWTRTLAAFSGMDEIVAADAAGKRDLRLFYEAHRDQIRSITRMDERGVILATHPFAGAEGTSIANQDHVREILRDHRPVVSEVFKAVQGFDAVALHVPVFKDDVFKGSIAVVIDFESLAKRYLDVIRIGESGYAWVVGRDGTLLYAPAPGFAGRSALREFTAFPSVRDMVARMIRGGEGAATYTFDWVGGRQVAPVRKYAIFVPVNLGNTFWSIAVASSEAELLATLKTFRNRLALVVGLVYLGGIGFSVLAAKAWLIVREEDRRKQAEQTLRESEARLQMLAETSPVGIFQTDASGATVYVNRRYAEICGMSPDEALDGGWLRAVHPEDRERVSRGWSGTGSSGRAMDAEYRFVRPDGTVAWVVGHAAPITTDDKLLGGYVGTITDITDRKRMEEAIRESEAQLSSILNNVSDIVFAVAVEPDERFRFTSVNRRFLEVTGLSESAVVGALVRDVIPQPAHELVFAKYREAIASGQPSHWEEASEYPSGRKVGHVTVVPVKDSAGRCRQLVGMVHDITDIKRAEEAVLELNTTLERRVVERTAELAVARDRAEESDRLKSAFLATMSHELRTPLNSIIGFTGILVKGLAGPVNEEQRKQLDMVNQSAAHLLELINDVLDLSKIEAGQFKIESAEFDLPAAIARAVAAVTPLAERKGLTLRSDVAPEVGTITSDRRRVEQVLLNLLSNAVKFTAEGGVAVECSAPEGEPVTIRVRDTGIGIRQADLRLLFRPFQQLDSGLTRAYDGTGLGLSICRRILDMLGGDISVESEWGRGSTFTVRLPAAAGRRG